MTREERIKKALDALDQAYDLMDTVMTSGQRLKLNQLTEEWEDMDCQPK